MSDTLVEASAGDRKEGQPESLNVETAQPSLLKKGGLFGNSAAKVGDGSPSPASQNGAEASSQDKNGDSDAGANGDEADLEDANGDSTGEDETMPVDEPVADEPEAPVDEEEEEEDKAAEEPEPAVQPAEESEEAAPVALPAEVMEDIEMAEDTDEEAEVESVDGKAEEKKEEEKEEEKEASQPAAAAAAADAAEEDTVEAEEEKKDDEEEIVVPTEDDADEEMPEEKEEEEEEKEDTEGEKDETAVEGKEEAKEEEDEVEEECVKKVISMDTDETADESAEAVAEEEEQSKEEEGEADDVTTGAPTADDETTLPLDATQDEQDEGEAAAAAAAATTPVATPKRGRGRPPKSASGTPAASQKTPAARKTPSVKKTSAAGDAVVDEEGEEGTEESSPSKRTPRGAAKRANEALASPPPSTGRGRGRSSLKSETSSSQADTVEEEEEQKEGEEGGEETAEEMKTPPSTGRGRRSIKSTPASAARTGRGRRIAEEIEDIEEEDAKEEEEEAEEGDKEEAKEEGEEAAVEQATTPKRGRRSQATSSPVKKAEETSVSPARRSTRGAGATGSKSPAKTPAAPKPTPKGRGRRSSVKSEETVETEGTEETEEKEEEEEEEKPKRRGRAGARKSGATKTPTASAKKAKKAVEDEEDPFDMDTELDKHPEPLRNITVEKGSFGEMKYTRSPAASKSKYAATERSAEEKVGNLPNTPAATGAPKTIASAQSTRKSLGGSPAKRTPAARRGGKRGGGEEGEDDEMIEEDEDAAMETPQERKGRGRPSGASTGRKRKASPTVATSAKRAAVCVTIPELDAESQWSADHPEDDSAPLVPGARVFAVFQKVFYPALVGERDGLGRYMVEFVEDKIVRPVPPAGVVPLSAVTIDKECLYQSSPDADPVYCRVLRSANAANAKDWLAGAFRLQEMNNDETEHDACWTSLQLDMATTEWKKYVNAKSKMVTKINTDNITSLEDRRERRSRVHNDTAVALATLTSGGTPEPSARRVAGARKTPSAASVSSAAKPTVAKTASGGRRGRKPKAAAAAAAAEDEAGDEEGEEKAEVKKEEKMEVDEKDKEDKKKEMNPRIFLNKTFILTSANRITTDVVFRKNEMKKQILERGGIVVEDINQVPLDAEAYLISDTHYRTHKYLAAMSRGMPCLSHKWLIECVAQEELLPYDEHKLAGGQGLLNGDLYPLPDVRGKLLVGRSIMVHSKTDTTSKRGTMGFKQIWSPIVELLGARVVSDACLIDVTSAEQAAKIQLPADFEILLTDSSCQPEVVAKLEAAGKAVVSSEWLIQSIIMGACPDFTAHPRFRYDSGNEPSKKEGSQDKSQS